VFLPGPLEPHYFCSDLHLDYRVSALEDYLDLFRGARECHMAVGETAGWYLHSDIALSEIIKFNAEARIIVLVRNPIELVRSLHAYNLVRCIENEPDFEAAWSLQEARRQGRHLPPNVGESKQLQYRWVGCLGVHLERAMSNVPEEQLRVIVHDDLQAAPKRVYEELLAFLSLQPDQRTQFPRVNISERSRSVLLQRLLYEPPTALRLAARAMTSVIDAKRVYGAVDRLRRLNRTGSPPAPLSPTCRKKLAAAFEEDVALSSRLIGRDFSGWMRA